MMSLRWLMLVGTATFAACANLVGIDNVHPWKGAAGGISGDAQMADGGSSGAPIGDAAGGSIGGTPMTPGADGGSSGAPIGDAAGGSIGGTPMTPGADGGSSRASMGDAAGGSSGDSAIPPTFTVVSTSPVDRMTGVDPTSNINITFSDSLDAQSINTSTVRLLQNGQAVPCDVAAGERTVTLIPKDPPLSLATRYLISLADVILDAGHHSLAGQRTFEFTTRDVVRREPFTRWPANSASPMPRLAINARGNAYAIFGGRRTSEALPATAFIYRYDVSGSVWTMKVSYDTARNHMVTSSDVAMDDQDRVCATWCDQTQDGGDILDAAWYPGGAGQWTPSPTDLNAPDHWPVDSPQVALAKNGLCWIVWAGRKPVSGGTNEYVMSWVNNLGSGSSSQSPLASQPSSGWVPVPVVAAGPTPSDVVTAFADPMSNIVAFVSTSPKVVLATGGSKAPAVAVDPVGNAIVVWEQSDSAVSAYASRLPHGGSWPQMGTRISGGVRNVSHLAVAASADESFVAVWQQEQVGNSQVHAIFANRWSSERGDWEGAVAIPQTDTTTDAVTPHVALDATGNAMVTWQQSGKDIWVTRFVGGVWQPAQKLSTGQPGSAPRVALDSRGRGFVVWAESSNVVVARFD